MSEDGVTAHMISHLFNRIWKDPEAEYSISCSFLQIYNEHIYDLLNPRNSLECTVREDATIGKGPSTKFDSFIRVAMEKIEEIGNLLC